MDSSKIGVLDSSEVLTTCAFAVFLCSEIKQEKMKLQFLLALKHSHPAAMRQYCAKLPETTLHSSYFQSKKP
ncbi:hypothetical protein MHYP_G00304760 [Metynnis hypsauchen]